MVWDTAGQEEFDAITKAYYRGNMHIKIYTQLIHLINPFVCFILIQQVLKYVCSLFQLSIDYHLKLLSLGRLRFHS